MKYSLLVNAAPGSAAACTALEVARALLAREHQLYRVFLFRDGVRLACADAAREATAVAWQRFVRDNRLDAVVCITAALRRGMITDAEARNAGQGFARVAPGFQVSGLGQWADAMAGSDRVLSFG